MTGAPPLWAYRVPPRKVPHGYSPASPSVCVTLSTVGLLLSSWLGRYLQVSPGSCSSCLVPALAAAPSPHLPPSRTPA